MEKRILTPKEIAQATIQAGIGKTKLSIVQMLVLGIFAGIFISFGGQGSIVASQSIGGIDVGLSKLIFAAVFPVGLMLVVICGAELFTGNNLMTLGVFKRECGLKCVLKNWFFVYFFTVLGKIPVQGITSHINNESYNGKSS